jgi:hypothetical protein
MNDSYKVGIEKGGLTRILEQNMIANLEVLDHNKAGHLDIEGEIQRQKDGLFTFIVRVAENKIVDIVFLSYESYEATKESDFPHNT